MKLTDLKPELDGLPSRGYLSFECPMGHPHRIRIPVGEPHAGGKSWKATGEYPEQLSLTPSIHAFWGVPHDDTLRGDDYGEASGCGWHGWIVKGEIVTA